MQIHTAGEIASNLLVCSILAICAEALIELWLTASPLEPIRAFVARNLTESRRFGWVVALLTCGYCMSVWVAAAAAFIPSGICGNALLAWFINFLLIHRLSNLFHNKMMHNIKLEPWNNNDEASH